MAAIIALVAIVTTTSAADYPNMKQSSRKLCKEETPNSIYDSVQMQCKKCDATTEFSPNNCKFIDIFLCGRDPRTPSILNLTFRICYRGPMLLQSWLQDGQRGHTSERNR